MKQILESGYLGGLLTINVYPEKRLVEGKLFVTESINEAASEFTCKAVCAEGDKFTEAKGIKLVKLKLAKKYHASENAFWKAMLDNIEINRKFVKEKVSKHTSKLANIEKVLEKDFEITQPTKKNKKKVVKKKSSTKK